MAKKNTGEASNGAGKGEGEMIADYFRCIFDGQPYSHQPPPRPREPRRSSGPARGLAGVEAEMP